MIERTIAVTTHGRYLVRPAPSRHAPVLVACHGYAEDAELQMTRLEGAAGADRWTLVSVQALHRFYRGRSESVIASWMTRQDRELMIDDNVAYVSAVIDAVQRDESTSDVVVFAGFSQGASMAYRAACLGRSAPAGVITTGGDIPPELTDEQLARIPAVLIGRGREDAWYSVEKYASDQQRLRDAGVRVDGCEFDRGHEWSDEFNRAAGPFLAALTAER